MPEQDVIYRVYRCDLSPDAAFLKERALYNVKKSAGFPVTIQAGFGELERRAFWVRSSSGRFGLADTVTGTLYDPETGACYSSLTLSLKVTKELAHRFASIQSAEPINL